MYSGLGGTPAVCRLGVYSDRNLIVSLSLFEFEARLQSGLLLVGRTGDIQIDRSGVFSLDC